MVLLLAWLLAWLAPASSASFSVRTDRLINRLKSLGVVIDRLERCGPWAERAPYNMGVVDCACPRGCAMSQGFSWMC